MNPILIKGARLYGEGEPVDLLLADGQIAGHLHACEGVVVRGLPRCAKKIAISRVQDCWLRGDQPQPERISWNSCSDGVGTVSAPKYPVIELQVERGCEAARLAIELRPLIVGKFAGLRISDGSMGNNPFEAATDRSKEHELESEQPVIVGPQVPGEIPPLGRHVVRRLITWELHWARCRGVARNNR